MKTIDIHSHLLSPQVRFDRLLDRFAVRFFASSLGVDPRELKTQPWETYVTSMACAVAASRFVEKTCLFGVDCQIDSKGRECGRDRTVCAMSEDVISVAHRYPQQFIPFFSINPLRPNALDLIDEYMEKGCRGAKFLQNYWGVDLNHPDRIPYYEKLKQYKLPLVIHIGSEYSIKSVKSLEGIDMLNLPLEVGVTVIAAHMGLGRFNHKLLFWRNLSRNPAWFDDDYFRLLEMLEQYDNLYADISAMLIPLRARALPHLAKQKQIHHKILFGTDYPVPFMIRFNTHGLPRCNTLQIAKIKNPFDRYISLMLEFFPDGSPVYSNFRKILPRE
ncbi:MAG TPA: mannonate dehydratase [Gammaproteobacteria bacterium]|nr:mannonate dehydratase [Gammaproteobacteria bacterium]